MLWVIGLFGIRLLGRVGYEMFRVICIVKIWVFCLKKMEGIFCFFVIFFLVCYDVFCLLFKVIFFEYGYIYRVIVDFYSIRFGFIIVCV